MKFKDGDLVRFSKQHIMEIENGVFDTSYNKVSSTRIHDIFTISVDSRNARLPYRLLEIENDYDWSWNDNELDLVDISLFGDTDDFLL